MSRSRRSLLAGSLTGVVALSLWPARAAAEPRRVLIVGDSMIAGAFGLYLEQRLEKQHGFLVLRRGKSSTGLARPDFFDWIEEGGRLREQFAPDAVVAMFGGNDGQGLHMGRKAEPKWIRWTEEGWTEEYRRRVNAFTDVVTAGGERIFWVGMPVMKPSKLHARVRHMNRIYRAEMAIRSNAKFVDIWRLLADGDGEYADKVEIDGKRVRVRAGDGVHLSGAGATALVDRVAPLVASQLDA